jgi:hypothetical protein
MCRENCANAELGAQRKSDLVRQGICNFRRCSCTFLVLQAQRDLAAAETAEVRAKLDYRQPRWRISITSRSHPDVRSSSILSMLDAARDDHARDEGLQNLSALIARFVLQGDDAAIRPGARGGQL